MKQSNQPKSHRPISHGATWLALLLCLILPIQPALAGEIIYYFPDASGSPVLATDEDGDIIWREHYQPYGEKVNEVCPMPCDDLSNYVDIGYTGHEYDAETGLTYMQARYYDPAAGRFLGIDPVGFKPAQPMTFNRYSYANNNPYKYVDPDGRAVCIIAPPAPVCIAAVIEVVTWVGVGIGTLVVAHEATEAIIESNEEADENSDKASENGSKKEKAKERRKKQREASKIEKHGDSDWEEPASEDYVKWKANELEKKEGKDKRRQAHDEKQKGER